GFLAISYPPQQAEQKRVSLRSFLLFKNNYFVEFFPEPLCHQLLPAPSNPLIIRFVFDILLRDLFDITKQSFLLDWAELEKVSAKYDDGQTTKVSILKSTEVPQ